MRHRRPADRDDGTAGISSRFGPHRSRRLGHGPDGERHDHLYRRIRLRHRLCRCCRYYYGVGLVAQVGADFDLGILRLLSYRYGGGDHHAGRLGHIRYQPGVATAASRSVPTLESRPSRDSTCSPKTCFQPDLRASGDERRRHQQLAWLKFLRDKGCQARVSADMFEPFVAARAGCLSRDLRSRKPRLPERSGRPGTFSARGRILSKPTVLKRGPAGRRVPGRECLGTGSQPARVREVDPIGAGWILAGSVSRPACPRVTRKDPGLDLLSRSGNPIGDGVRGGRPGRDR